MSNQNVLPTVLMLLANSGAILPSPASARSIRPSSPPCSRSKDSEASTVRRAIIKPSNPEGNLGVFYCVRVSGEIGTHTLAGEASIK